MSNPVIDHMGTKRWYHYDNLHREDGPAVEWSSGTKMWFRYDELHRENGPAVEWANGSKEWFLNDKEYTKDEFRVIQFAKGIDCV